MSIASEKKLSDLEQLVKALLARVVELERKTEWVAPPRRTLTAPKKTEKTGQPYGN